MLGDDFHESWRRIVDKNVAVAVAELKLKESAMTIKADIYMKEGMWVARAAEYDIEVKANSIVGVISGFKGLATYENFMDGGLDRLKLGASRAVETLNEVDISYRIHD